MSTESPIAAREGCDFTILPWVANVPPWLPKPKDPHFKSGAVKSYKFVDDNVNTCKINMRQAKMLTENGVCFKEIVDKRTEALLQHVSDKALNKGMIINASKTSLMCMSAAKSFKAKVRVSLEGESVMSNDKLKILGVTLDSDVSFRSHVETIATKCRAKSWVLGRLRKKGLKEDKLVTTYKTLICPSLEYAAPAWHSLLTAGQAADLERQQVQYLHNIYGHGLSANKLRKKVLSTRRESISKKFSVKCLSNERSAHWLKKSQSPRTAEDKELAIQHIERTWQELTDTKILQ